MYKIYLEAIVKRKQNDDNVINVLNIDSWPAVTGKGENYLSSVLRCRLKILLGSGQAGIKHLIIKRKQTESTLKPSINEELLFKNEIFMYKVMRKMKNLMRDFNDHRETLWCEMIGYKTSEEIIIEDLQDLGYSMMDRRQNLNYEHSVFTIKALARIHAMSKILQKQSLIQAEDFISPIKQTYDLFFGSSIAVMEKAVRTFWEPKWEELAEVLALMSRNLKMIFNVNLKFHEERFNVLNIGDAWTNNLFFKHIEDTETPCGIKFIDFQHSHFNSFAWDLTYFIYTSVVPEIRRKNLNEFISLYHKTICNELMLFNFPEIEFPTITHIQEEMERLKFHGFQILCSIYAFTITDVVQPLDLAVLNTNRDAPEMGIKMEIFTSTNYRKRIEEDLDSFLKQGLKDLLEKYLTAANTLYANE